VPSAFLQAISNEGARIGRFAIVGVLATLLHSAVYSLLITVTPIAPLLANLLAFASALSMSFFGHQRWTFKEAGERAVAHGGSVAHFGRFFLTSVLGLALNSAAVYVVVNGLGLEPIYAVVPMLFVVPPITFICMKLWVFAPAAGGRA
jgi:putative flippase GtrA